MRLLLARLEGGAEDVLVGIHEGINIFYSPVLACSGGPRSSLGTFETTLSKSRPHLVGDGSTGLSSMCLQEGLELKEKY